MMPEISIPVPLGFTEMPKADQIRYLQALWDQIAESPGEIPVPQSHLDLAEARLGRYRQDPPRARSAFESLDRLRKKSK